MLTLSAQYALRAALHLAETHPQPRTNADIAAATGVPERYLSKIMLRLRLSNVVEARRGLGGGYQLACQPAEVSALDIIRPVESDGRLGTCEGCSGAPLAACHVHLFLDGVLDEIDRLLASHSLLDLLQGVWTLPSQPHLHCLLPKGGRPGVNKIKLKFPARPQQVAASATSAALPSRFGGGIRRC